jgi:dihydrolipoamide dehydrogenase
VPHIRGLEKTPYLTYKEILRLEKKPRKLLIIGGGFIAVELGYFYAMMGTEVEFILRSTLMSALDDDIITEFTHSMSKLVTINCDPNILRVHHKNDTFTVMTENNIYDGDALLLATGMTPNTDILNLKNTDIACDDKGFVTVNDSLETTVKGVYAFGDIIGRHMFRHTANYEGEYVFSRVFKNHLAPIKYPPVPYAVFSNPQIAGVGESEKSVKEKNIPTIIAMNAYKKSAMGMALLSETGFCKLLFNKDTRALIGAHIIGREASTMIHMCIAYLKMNATVDDMSDTIYIHPALPEIVRNAVRDAIQQFSSMR